jgi:hypothetical protein
MYIYTFVLRMNDTMTSQNIDIASWHTLYRRKRGRPKLTRAEGIRGLMGEKGLVEEDWNNRQNWRKKII